MDHNDPTYSTPEERAAGLGHTRSGIRRRARWGPLVLLLALAAVVAVLMALRATDRLDSQVRAFEFDGSIASMEVSVTNTGDSTVRVLGPGVNAGDSAVGAVWIVGPDTIEAGQTVVFGLQATILCEPGQTFSVEPVIRIEDRQKGRWIVFTEPDGWLSEPVVCGTPG